jgi:hypothetical protein
MSWIYGLARFRARGAVGWNEVLIFSGIQKKMPINDFQQEDFPIPM